MSRAHLPISFVAACLFLFVSPLLGADKRQEIQLRFLSFENGGKMGRFEIVNRSGNDLELFRSAPFPEECAPFEPGFHTAEYWHKGKWHPVGGTPVGHLADVLQLPSGEKLVFAMELFRLRNVRSGTLVRVLLERVDGAAIHSEPFRWRGMWKPKPEKPLNYTALPERIKEALKSIPKIQADATLEPIFRTLGFDLSGKLYNIIEDETTDADEPRERYDIGFGREYVLECTYNLEIPALVLAVKIRKMKGLREWGPVYDTLLPTWKKPASEPKRAK